MSDEIRVTLKITDFECSPEEISNLLGIKPTKQWERGDVIDLRVTRRRGNNGWMLASGLSTESSVQQQIKVLLEILLPRKERFMVLPEGSRVAINCIIYTNHGRPDISLSVDIVSAIGSINAGLDFDLYLLPSETSA
jgi:hypothetical protein